MLLAHEFLMAPLRRVFPNHRKISLFPTPYAIYTCAFYTLV